ncbi:MAG TPA: hypothetical protein VF676_08730 [Flavobacterium sp.]|jgi:hypothetical protein
MKRIILLVLLIFTASISAQELAITTANVLGKWELYDITNSKLSKEDLEESKSFLEGTFLQLNADKTCVLSIVMDLDGTWRLDEANRIITTVTRRGQRVWKIQSLQKDTIILSPDDATHRLVFKRP